VVSAVVDHTWDNERFYVFENEWAIICKQELKKQFDYEVIKRIFIWLIIYWMTISIEFIQSLVARKPWGQLMLASQSVTQRISII